MYLGGFIFKIKQILKEKTTLLIITLFVFGTGLFLGWWLSTPLTSLPKNPENSSSIPKTKIDESSKVIIHRNAILRGRVENITSNSITVAASGETLTVPLKSDTTVNIITQTAPTGTPQITAGKLNDVQIGNRVEVNMQASQPNINDLIGISITMLP